MRFGVGDEGVESGQDRIALGGADGIEQVNELLVSVIHVGMPDGKLFGPGEYGHGAHPV